MHTTYTRAIIPLFFLFLATNVNADEPNLKYPDTKRVDQVDDYHGTKVPDPYRWLEKDVRNSDHVRAWVTAQNKVTRAYLESIPERKQIEKRLKELWNYERFSTPSKVAGKYFYTRNDGLQNQSVLYVQDSLDAKPRELIDPNKWSKDGTVSLAGISVSDDGKYLAFGKSDAGSDWRTWYVMEVESGNILDDQVKWLKYVRSVSWAKDNKGFYYTRYPEPKKGEEFQGLSLKPKVYYHRVGTAQSQDELLYERPDHPRWGFGTDVSDDGKYLIITIYKGTDDRYRVVYKDISKANAEPVMLIDNFEHKYAFIGNDDSVFYFTTDNKAPRGRVIAIDIRKPDPENWKELIPQTNNALNGVGLVGNKFVCNYLKDASTQVRLHSLDGKLIREVELPGLGTASGFGGKRKDNETFYAFYSYSVPPSVYRYDLTTGKSVVFRAPKVKFDPDAFVTKQIFYKSKDGTKVPLFITHKKGIKLDGQNPTLLYGYGGFNISITPRFYLQKIQWMEMGGVFAVANIRGGGEYGKEWHQAAVKLNRPKAYEDFIAAAEWLIENDYTSTPKLAIQGGSNGGLLVGAVMCKRPDLFGACLPHVGVMDMLRFHKFTAGRYWVDDYGSSDDKEEFKVLYSYSPYHNLKPGVIYPPTLVFTADTDDRVVPSHSFKFLAQLQYCQTGDAPVLGRIETRAGHGAGRSTEQVIEEAADEWAFLVKTLKMKVDFSK